MTRRKNGYSLINPFQVWTELTMKTGEMMLASAQVIGHRTGRMASAGPLPNARDQREFTLMGQEKLEAAAESGQAMVIGMMRMNQQLSALAFKQMLSGTASMAAIASSRTPAQSIERQARLVRDTLAHSSAAARQISGSSARIAQKGLTPIHSRATGNAKRLRKR